jgi:hypothetical protein
MMDMIEAMAYSTAILVLGMISAGLLVAYICWAVDRQLGPLMILAPLVAVLWIVTFLAILDLALAD